MFGFRFFKSRPTDYIVLFKGGRPSRQGLGFSGFIFTPSLEGEVTRQAPLIIESRMEGIIFADGIEADPLRFDAGVTATITPAEQRVRLVQ